MLQAPAQNPQVLLCHVHIHITGAPCVKVHQTSNAILLKELTGSSTSRILKLHDMVRQAEKSLHPLHFAVHVSILFHAFHGPHGCRDHIFLEMETLTV